MRLIGAGFGRTGTMSLKVALEQLGFNPCYHMIEVFDKPGHDDLWYKAARGQSIDWEDIFGDYQATVDWPACAFYSQLMERYPDAPVLLTVRDPERWYTSVVNTIYLTSSMHSDDPERRAHADMIRAVIWDGTFHGRLEDKAYALSIFEQHIQEVKARVPAERLLVYDVRQGWEPLCAFLGVPVPVDTPFPRLNDTQAFHERIAQRAQEMQGALKADDTQDA